MNISYAAKVELGVPLCLSGPAGLYQRSADGMAHGGLLAGLAGAISATGCAGGMQRSAAAAASCLQCDAILHYGSVVVGSAVKPGPLSLGCVWPMLPFLWWW